MKIYVPVLPLLCYFGSYGHVPIPFQTISTRPGAKEALTCLCAADVQAKQEGTGDHHPGPALGQYHRCITNALTVGTAITCYII